MSTTKEAIYDKQISPLMKQIINICRENKIANICHFELGEDEEGPLRCTTTMATEEFEPSDSLKQVIGIIYKKPEYMTSIVVTNK